MDLKNKVIILTGAARIGLDVAQGLKSNGAKLAVTYFTSKPDLGDDVLYVQANLSKEADAKKVVAETKKKFGQIDGLVYMAANYPNQPWKTLTEKDWDSTMNTIAKSAFSSSSTFVSLNPSLRKNRAFAFPTG